MTKIARTSTSEPTKITKLTDIITAYTGDISQLTAKALSNAIKKAIQEGHIGMLVMIPLTAPETKFTFEDNGRIKMGMPIDKNGKAEKGFQAYGNDSLFLILLLLKNGLKATLLA